MEEQQIVLRYVGNGFFVMGVPARDLTETDIAESGMTAEQIMAHAPPVYEAVSGKKDAAPKIVEKEVTHG